MALPGDELLHLARDLMDTDTRAQYVACASSWIRASIRSDEVIWFDTDFTSDTYTAWRHSTGTRDRNLEDGVGALRSHPTIQSYLAEPTNLSPRRMKRMAQFDEEIHQHSLQLSRELIGRYQLGLVLHVESPGAGRAFVAAAEARDFRENDVGRALSMIPVLVAFDHLWNRPLPDAPRVAASCGTSPGLSDASVQLLTPRERQVVDLISSGCKATTAARILGISPRTVQKHLQHSYAKLGEHDRLGVALKLRESGQPKGGPASPD